MNLVIIVIVPTIGSITGLAAPTSIPPFATTSASFLTQFQPCHGDTLIVLSSLTVVLFHYIIIKRQ
jgi:hypothetical protein